MGISSTVIYKYYIANLSPDNIKKIKDLNGTIQNGYCYEKLLENKELQDFLKTPSVAKIDDPKSNQWQGFYTDADGKHWGTVSTLANIFDISKNIIKKHTVNLSTDNIKEIKDLAENIQKGYCYEDVIKIPEMQKLLNKKNQNA